MASEHSDGAASPPAPGLFGAAAGLELGGHLAYSLIVGQGTDHMANASSRTLGALILPHGFPAAEFDDINGRVARKAGTDLNAWLGFASAWNGVAFRLRGALDHASTLRKTLASSSAPPPEDRFRQDHDLFGFFTSSVSAVECFCFAAHCIGSLLRPKDFPLQGPGQLRFRAKELKDRYKVHFPNDALTRELDAALESGEYAQAVELRNVLAHRGTLSRRHFMSTSGPDTPSAIPSNPAELASAWRYDMHLAPSALDPIADWLEREVSRLVIAAATFVRPRM